MQKSEPRVSQAGQAKVVGRLAPSPTGRMHLGNIYACLAAWLGVRSQGSGGVLRLRIEDIDRPRVVQDADRWIMDDLAWLGLDWDGEVVYQSQRADAYHQALKLLESSQLIGGQPLIYPCFCSRADIRAASAPNEGDGFIVYPGTCRGLSPQVVSERLARGQRHSIRIAVPDQPDEPDAICRFDDLIFGPQSFNLPRQVGDVVVRRSDGLVSYQLAVTVDDLAMGVNQIVRGRDLLRSTAIQMWIRYHLQPQAPRVQYAHLPLIDGVDGRRMSKRFGSPDLGSLRRDGWSARQVLGVCGWLLGLLERPRPASAQELLDGFTWNILAADRKDRQLDLSELNVSDLKPSL
ncbi:tRNA glutamyl-Q(34) synthetase GluQRS [Bifidobacterium apousia]|uniref:tRNA glutamyl-Q(34) synthetase GluQRS n=1 Tax=Bifidobacterium apousia TaxID=2750996 RepID=UPI0018DCEB96|nr:tRNA glutamyl-Q(34) synthetase GluQRS [Bifidobacterium apousia]MBI0062158.1 tRNA glutamyl-Q(34) synthetase GluQRS [Bifidobacterium apousia]